MVESCTRSGEKGYKPKQGGTCFTGKGAKNKANAVEIGIKKGVSESRRLRDRVDYIDFLQVLGASFLGTMLVLFTATVSPPDIRSGLILFFFIIFAVAISIIGIMKGFYPKRLFFFLLTAIVVAYPFSAVLGILLGDITFQTLFSLEYFKTITFASFLIGTSVGALADAVKS